MATNNKKNHGDTARKSTPTSSDVRYEGPSVLGSIEDTPVSRRRLTPRDTAPDALPTSVPTRESSIDIGGFLVPRTVAHPDVLRMPNLVRHCNNTEIMKQFFSRFASRFEGLQEQGRIASTLAAVAVTPNVAVLTSPARLSTIHQKTRLLDIVPVATALDGVASAVASSAQNGLRGRVKGSVGVPTEDGTWLTLHLVGPIGNEASRISQAFQRLDDSAPHLYAAVPFAYIHDPSHGAPATKDSILACRWEPSISKEDDLHFGPLVEYPVQPPA